MNGILNINGVECYEENGTAYLKLETVARGLGFTENKNDKGYTDKALTNELKCQDINLMTLKRSNSKIKWSKETQRMIFNKRRRIETTFSQLSEQLNAEKVLAKSTLGLYTRMLTKIFAYDICILINKLSGNEYNCSRIKHLIF